MSRARAVVALAFLCATALVGCASTAPPAAGVPPVAGKASAPGAGTSPAQASVVPRDSLPSADAQEVLASIAEPLPAGERVPPPPAGALIGSAPVVDTARAAPSADTAATVPADSLPVPAPTAPLGDAPGAISSAEAAAVAAGATAGGAAVGAAAAPVAGATPAAPDTCWRVQVAAPDERAKAESRRSAAESLLLVPVTIEPEKGLFKVRTRDCLSRTAADRLRDRARASGFDGAFTLAGKRP